MNDDTAYKFSLDCLAFLFSSFCFVCLFSRVGVVGFDVSLSVFFFWFFCVTRSVVESSASVFAV